MPLDIANNNFLKLTQTKDTDFDKVISELLIDGEYVIAAFKTVRDGVVFTNKRIITIDIKGVIGKRKNFTIIPYKNISVFSIETAGVLDIDSELSIWIQSVGKVTFEFLSNSKIKEICKTIGVFAL